MRVHELRLRSSWLLVKVRLLQLDGGWLASAETPDGPNVGIGRLPEEALTEALEPFGAIVDELMETVPDEFSRIRAGG
jgi:hypothetical protein